MDRRNELFKIEEHSILTDSSLSVAQLFHHDSGPFALYPSFIVHKNSECMFFKTGNIDNTFKIICYSNSM